MAKYLKRRITPRSQPAYHIESKIIVYMCPTLAKLDFRNFMSVMLGESLI